MSIMYVCDPCSENEPESSGYYERDKLRILPTGDWICEGCYENGEEDYGRWSRLPIPPEYVPAGDTK